ncbi:unnamed protein product [Adineta steineri]|uniref:Amidase domain-containing protein n=1 Tax=Adineta steineri TaxID=433720 RepID=A0A818VH39_9BILA|nr:unnamed protein product [Adineta steineri]
MFADLEPDTSFRSCFESLTNELIYKIFDYLDVNDIYFGFFYLNNRFQNLYLNSDIAYQLNLSNISKRDFQSYHHDVLKPNQDRIKILHLSNPFTIDLIFCPSHLIINFIQIEKLILDNISSKYLLNILKYLIHLPQLYSLNLSIIDYIDNLSPIFLHIFCLTKLKSCQLTYQVEEDLLNDFTQLEQSSIEYLIINSHFRYESLQEFLLCLPKLRHLSMNSLIGSDHPSKIEFAPIELKDLKSVSLELYSIHFHQLKNLITNCFKHIEKLSITTFNDSTYLSGKQWQQIISSSLPNLRIFDLQNNYNSMWNKFVYAWLSSDFRSSFWKDKQWFFQHCYNGELKSNNGIFFSTNPYRRKDYQFYWNGDHNRTNSNMNQDDYKSVHNLFIHDAPNGNEPVSYFPNVKEITIYHCDSILTSLDRILPLHQVNKLVIDSKKFRVNEILNLIEVTPNLKTFQLFYYSFDESRLKLIEESKIYQSVINKNKIENFQIIHCCSLKEISFFMNLFPKLKSFETGLLKKEFIFIIQYLLLNMAHLNFLCIKHLSEIYLDKINLLIESNNLLKDYSIKLIDDDLFLWCIASLNFTDLPSDNLSDVVDKDSASVKTLSLEQSAPKCSSKDLPNLYDASIKELQDGLKKNCFTSVDLVNAYIARIDEVNLKGPTLHAVIEISPSALKAAISADTLRKSGKVLSPLHGIPMLLKDNIATRCEDGMNTTAGSFALFGSITQGDATVAEKLRNAGAIILGKTALSEWANFRGFNIPNGWSGRGGQATSPFYPQGDACGSSTGSAIASSIGLAAATLGTETDGSIICPSNRNNVVAIKPTVGLVSRNLVIPISQNQDTVGPICRSVADAAAMLTIIAGRDGADNYTLSQPEQVPCYTDHLKKDGLKGARIGVLRHIFTNSTFNGYPDYVIAEFNNTIENVFKKLGAIIIDPADLETADELAASDSELTVLTFDFKYKINEYLSQLKSIPSGVRTLQDLINYNNIHADVEMPLGRDNQILFLMAQNTTNLQDPIYLNALNTSRNLGGRRGIDATLKKYNLDALIAPSEGFTTTPAAVAGYPIITVPLGFLPNDTQVMTDDDTNSLNLPVWPAPNFPFGISFMGTAYSEAKLIELAYCYEQATLNRKKGQPFKAAIPKSQLSDIVHRK